MSSVLRPARKRNDARGLIEGPIEEVELDPRNVDRWERVTAGTR